VAVDDVVGGASAVAIERTVATGPSGAKGGVADVAVGCYAAVAVIGGMAVAMASVTDVAE
jgi:hypothetical protein